MRRGKVHLGINRPGGAFSKTACGLVLLAGSGMDRVRYPRPFSWGVATRGDRCARCERAYPFWEKLQAEGRMPWQAAS